MPRQLDLRTGKLLTPTEQIGTPVLVKGFTSTMMLQDGSFLADEKWIQICASKDVREFWPLVRKFILDASERARELTEASIVWSLLSEEMTLFLAMQGQTIVGAATVEVQHYPVRSIAQLVHLGATRWEMVEVYLPVLEVWAKSRGCKTIRVSCRKGLARKIEPLGFKHVSQVMEKEL